MAKSWLFLLLAIKFPAIILGCWHEHISSDFPAQCAAFEPLKYVTNSTVNVHEFVPANTTLYFPDTDPSCGGSTQKVTVDVCRIALNISTSERSGIIFESWLPANWSGRFLTTGNGGIDGCMKYTDIDYATQNGFSAVGSNNGHNGTGGTAFLHNEDVLEDYVYRSLHVITEIGKNLTEAFYATAPKTSYYLGCSGGGRQGMKAAEMFPKDFDGIVIGAPALNFNNMTSWRASFFGKTGAKNSTNFISPQSWAGFIHDEVVRQCDTIDGAADGIIENPTACDFEPEALICSGNHTTACLSSAQAEIVRAVLSPLYGSNGELVFPALQPGSEVSASTGLLNGSPWPYSLDWFRYVVYNTTSFIDTNFSTADITAAAALNQFNVQTFPSDLSPFSSRGNKLLIFHGQQDHQITSYSSERFYNHLSSSMSLPPSALDSFVRLFRISGMGHCNSGPGAWMIGQSASGSTGWDAESNVLAAMVSWVEDGIAPETIEGTKFVGDMKGMGVERRRKHCRYPLTNRYVGGNASEPEGWKCM